MKANQTATPQKHLVVVNNHQYLMGETQFLSVLQVVRDKFRAEHQTAIYAITKGNVTQMVEEHYDSALKLRKAIKQYKCKGFHKVYYYLAI